MSDNLLTLEGKIINDRWHAVRDTQAALDTTDPFALLPLETWLARHTKGTANGLGVWLAPDTDPAALAPFVSTLSMIAIEFPRFFDGRGYSIATLLHRYGYRGELRAIGEVLIDQIFHLKRVGFTSFELRADQNRKDAAASLHRYSNAHQAAADLPLPLFRRRVAQINPIEPVSP